MVELIFVVTAVFVRLAALAISMRNERSLLDGGAIEHGARTSKVIASAHIAYYDFAIVEGASRFSPYTSSNHVGLFMYVISICALFWVIFMLGRLWTVKLYIAPNHRLETNWIFNRIRHPNYFLNIIPELVGFALVLSAWVTLAIGMPIYLVILLIRIRQEERIMRRSFPQY